ncbi:MAG: serpin family protein [Oscillospiraceae bacterium]|nr:serpin family protein [Oscillospiraceae bacterium]
MKRENGKECRKKRRLTLTGVIAALLAVAVLGGCAGPAVGTPDATGTQAIAAPTDLTEATEAQPTEPIPTLEPQVIDAHTLAMAQYPEMAQYPYMEGSGNDPYSFGNDDLTAWYDALGERWQYRDKYDALELSGFLKATLPQFLGGAEGENRVYSPVNIYMALALLAETADGEGRTQILDLMGVSNMDELRTRVNAIWNANYRDDGMAKSLFANSLWLNENVRFRQDTLKLLAEQYFASSYYGEMGTEEMDALLHDWMNKQTDGLLKEQINGIGLDADTVAALVSTLYFSAKWDAQFAESNTEESVFHATDGDEPCRMMRQSVTDGYYWADQFTAVGQSFESGGRMWLLLPDEGVTPEDLLDDPQTLSFLLSKGGWESVKYLTVNKQIPKFDIDAQFDATEILQALGVTDVFDPVKADFSPLAEEPDGIFVSDVIHGARVLIDEDGCKAAAYTIIMTEATAAEPPAEEVDFILDRPFLFAITGADGLPLFIGIVNHPNRIIE